MSSNDAGETIRDPPNPEVPQPLEASKKRYLNPNFDIHNITHKPMTLAQVERDGEYDLFNSCRDKFGRLHLVSKEEVIANAVHVTGVGRMDTKKLFSIFERFYPAEIEWIDDNSCNVLFPSPTQVGELYETLKAGKVGEGTEIYGGDEGDWAEMDGLRMRLKTKNDRKWPGAESRSEYYRIHGNPNYGNIRGIITQSFRRGAKRRRI